MKFGLLRDYNLDGPEVGGEVGAGEVIVRHPAGTFDAPLSRPGVSDKEQSAYVVIADSHQGMAADVGLPSNRQGHEASVLHIRLSKD